jgi:hypothetical protein
MTDTTNKPPKDPKPSEGSGVCLTPDKPDSTDPKATPEKSDPK